MYAAHFGTKAPLRTHRTFPYGSLTVLAFVSKLCSRTKPYNEGIV